LHIRCIVSNDFAVKRRMFLLLNLVVSDCVTDTLILIYQRFLAAYQVMLRVCQKREVPWDPLNPPESTTVLYFNHNNGVSKKKLTNKYTN